MDPQKGPITRKRLLPPNLVDRASGVRGSTWEMAPGIDSFRWNERGPWLDPFLLEQQGSRATPVSNECWVNGSGGLVPRSALTVYEALG